MIAGLALPRVYLLAVDCLTSCSSAAGTTCAVPNCLIQCWALRAASSLRRLTWCYPSNVPLEPQPRKQHTQPSSRRISACLNHLLLASRPPPHQKPHGYLKTNIFHLGVVLDPSRCSVSRFAAVSYPDSRGWSKGSLTGDIPDRLPGSATLGFDHDPCSLHIQTLLRHDALASSVSATTPVMVCASWGNRRFGALSRYLVVLLSLFTLPSQQRLVSGPAPARAVLV